MSRNGGTTPAAASNSPSSSLVHSSDSASPSESETTPSPCSSSTSRPAAVSKDCRPGMSKRRNRFSPSSSRTPCAPVSNRRACARRPVSARCSTAAYRLAASTDTAAPGAAAAASAVTTGPGSSTTSSRPCASTRSAEPAGTRSPSESVSSATTVIRSSTPFSCARSRRVASAFGFGSTTVTRQPAAASGTAQTPLPPPTSTTVASGRARASSCCSARQTAPEPRAVPVSVHMATEPNEGTATEPAQGRACRSITAPGRLVATLRAWTFGSGALSGRLECRHIISQQLPATLELVHTVAVLSLKGGVGKTTVALGITSAALRRGIRTLVADLDPQGNATASLDPPYTETTLADVLETPHRAVLHQAIAPSVWSDEINVLVGAEDLEALNEPGPDERKLANLSRALDELHDAPPNGKPYDLVILDCPPSLGRLTKSALVAA